MKYLALSVFITTAFAAPTPVNRTHDISVRNLGAKGDGIADDTAALQSAFDSSCSASFAISNSTGTGVSPIVITTATPHNFLNGSVITIAGVAGNTNANGEWLATVLSSTSIALYSQDGEASIGNGT